MNSINVNGGSNPVVSSLPNKYAICLAIMGYRLILRLSMSEKFHFTTFDDYTRSRLAGPSINKL